MAIQSQPTRIPEPFAGSGTRNTIPATNTTPSASQAASWASGFPPECSQPISAGGCPVPRNDVNGALNQLSQDFAFRQDGGIWEWSALADYDTQRIVRGSDGLLYYSVAQSGPGIAAGAQDPTLDAAQAFWSSPEVPTRPADDNSNSAATTEWVSLWYANRLVPNNYYVDPVDGDDSNAGTSSDAPLKTVSHCVSVIINSIFPLPPEIDINLASGTYGERLEHSITGTRINFKGPSSGFAIFSGFYTGFPNLVTSISGRLQISSTVQVMRGSVLILGDGLYLNFDNLGSKTASFYVAQNGTLTIFSDTSATISYTGTNTFSLGTIDSIYGSRVVLSSGVTFSGTVTGSRYYVRYGSGISGTGSQTFIPGSSAGSTDATSYYV